MDIAGQKAETPVRYVAFIFKSINILSKTMGRELQVVYPEAEEKEFLFPNWKDTPLGLQ